MLNNVHNGALFAMKASWYLNISSNVWSSPRREKQLTEATHPLINKLEKEKQVTLIAESALEKNA